MIPVLDATEARVVGSLIEKSVVTPDQYPLTLNALTNACNQKSSREPVMSLDPGQVQHAVRSLSDRSLVRVAENFKSRVEKYTQTFCNTRYNDLKFDDAELALVCVLLLRGPQTPGELRTNCRRLHEFPDNGAVVTALQALVEHPSGPLVARLPKRAGRRDSEFAHLFSGPIDLDAYSAAAPEREPASSSRRDRIGELEARVEELERAVAELKTRLD